MLAKKVTALLVSAALVLTLLAGCGGGRNQSLSQMLLNLLDGQYQNVSVEIDSDLESKLRQAISESETDEELRAALEQLLGGGISFQRLGSGQQGDSAWTLIIYPGTDPNAAARSVYLDLDKVFAALPADGQYSSGFAMVEMENGYAILVKATVDKAGTEDNPDPVTLKSIAVTTQPKTTYWVGESVNPANMVITATYSNGTTKTLKDIKQSGDQGVSWTPDGALTTSDTSITITYGGKTTTVSVTVEEPTVVSLNVSTTSLSYNAGETFNPSQIGTVTATYTDGHTEPVDPADCTFSIGGQNINSSHQFKKEGSYTLTVSYDGGNAQIPLTVDFGAVSKITVSGPDKKVYELNETFDSTGLKVTAHDGYGNSKTITVYTITDKAGQIVNDSYRFTTVGTYTLTVKYGEKTAQLTITVEHKGYIYDKSSNTYYVSNETGLLAWSEAVQDDLTLNCTLTEDINMTGKEWTPIGNSFQTYNGTFDGQGYSITSLNASSLFGGIGESATVKNLQLVDVKLYESSGGTAGIVTNNYGQVIACSVTGNINAFSTVGGIANANQGSITACWFAGTLRKNESGGIVNYNFSIGSITACYWCANTDKGVYNNEGGTVEATKVDGANVTWQTAIAGMNDALTGNNYQWTLGTDGLPVLQKKQ